MLYRILFCLVGISLAVSAQAAEVNYENAGDTWAWSYGGDEGGSGSAYLGVDIADVTSERLSALKLKEEQGAEVTMVDQDAPAGKAGLKEHDVILTLNAVPVESAAQLRRMIRETPAGRVITLGISRDGQALTLKAQLASRSKRNTWVNPGDMNIQIPPIPPIPDMDIPVSIVVAHSSMRSGLMVENITPQLGDFFGVKNGKGVLIRSVEKGSRAEKSGFRAGDVIVKVNDQVVHDTSDFTHALRSASGGASSITVVRDKKEQSLTLTLPDKKDSGRLMEDSFDVPDITVAVDDIMSLAGNEMARIGPAMEKLQLKTRCLQDQQKMLRDSMKLRFDGEKLRHEMSGEWTEI